MASDKFFEKLSSYQKDLSSRIFDLVISRILSQAYLAFDENTKEEMKKVFDLGPEGYPNEEKEKFIKKNIPNLKKLFEEEVKKIEDNIKAEIEIRI